MLNKDPSAFMLEEYVQTNLGFFHLQDKINDWFKTFIALYGIPFTVLAAVIGIGDSTDSLDLFALPGIVAFLLAVDSIENMPAMCCDLGHSARILADCYRQRLG